MELVFYITNEENINKALQSFNARNLLEVEEGCVRGEATNLSHAVDLIMENEGCFIENTVVEITIKSEYFKEVFVGSNTMETIMELTIFHFGYNQEDVKPVEFSIRGVKKELAQKGFYLLKEIRETDTLYKGVSDKEYVYFYFKRKYKSEVILDSNTGSIKKKDC